jgi:HlyD family secretion protein
MMIESRTRPRAALALAACALAALALAGCGAAREEAPWSGYAEADLVYIAAGAGGTLRTLAVQRGATVRKGQPIATLDSEAEALGRDAASARRERAQAQQRNLSKGRRPLELRALEQQLAQAEAALALSSAQLQRNRGLVAQGYIAAIRLEELEAAVSRDTARVTEAQSLIALARQSARSDEVAAAEAEARASAADLELARWREGQKLLTAPADALVYDLMFRPGEWVSAGAPVAALLPAGSLKVRFFVPEPALARLAVGATVRIGCDGCAQDLTARVRFIAPQAEFTPPVIYSVGARSKLVFMAEAEPSPGAALKPGQPLDVRPTP